MARNDYRGDPRGSKRNRRAHQSGKLGPQKQSLGMITATGVTVDANNLLELGNQTGELIPVTASQTINGITMLPQGEWRRLQFGASCLLLYDSVKFVLPGNDNIQTSDGDVGLFYSNGGTANAQGNWKCVQYTRGGLPPPSVYNMIMAYIVVAGTLGTDGVNYTYNNGTNGLGATIKFIPAGAQTFDSQATGIGMVILVAGDSYQNGLYRVTTLGSVSVQEVWTRSAILDSTTKGNQGILVYVQFGQVYSDTIWAAYLPAESVIGDHFNGNMPVSQVSANPLGTTKPAGDLWVSDGQFWNARAMTGDATVAATGVLTLASVISSGGPTGNATTVPVLTWDVKGRLLVVSTATISGVSPVGSALTSARIWVGSGSNVAAEVAVTGDITITNAGVTAIGNLKIVTAMIAGNAVTSAKVDSTVIIGSGANAFTGDQSLGSHKLTNVTDPVSAQDAATKNYVDTQLQNISAKKECKCATTVALTELSYTNNGGVGDLLTIVVGVLLIDGQTLAVNDRVLIKNQANAAHNGVWLVQTVGTAIISPVFIRATDFDQSEDGIDGALVYVLAGTTLTNTLWFCTTGASITWGTTNINWSQFTGTTYTGDETTIHLSGTTFSCLAAPKLATARTINGTSFDGSANITVTAAAGTLTGATLAAGVTASSLTSFGTSPALTTPTITGGTITALTTLAIRDTSAAFDVTIAGTSSTALTAGRTLTIDVVNAARTFKLSGNLTVSAAATVSGTNTGDQTAASKTDQTTGTSTTVFVNPNVQQNHASAVKAWAQFHWTGAAISIAQSYNVTSITRNGAGDYTVNFTTAFADTGYALFGAGTTSGASVYFVAESQATARTTSAIRVIVATNAGATNDNALVSVAFAGNQ